MKKSKILMAAAFALSLSAAFAFKPSPSKVFTARFQKVGTACNAITTSDCDGPSTNPVCSDIFVSKNGLGQCQGATYQTVAH